MATEKTSLKTKLLDEQQSSSAVHVPSDDDDAAYSEADLSSPEAVKRALEGLASAEHAARSSASPRRAREPSTQRPEK